MAYDISDFSIGQRVRIREWDDMKEEFGLNEWYDYILCNPVFAIGMRPLCGATATIESFGYDENDILLKDWEDADGQRISVPELTGRDWHYSADMLEPVEEVPPEIQYDHEMFLDMIGVAHG